MTITLFKSVPAIRFTTQRNKLLIYEKRETLSPTEIVDVLTFADGFVGTLNNVEAQSV